MLHTSRYLHHVAIAALYGLPLAAQVTPAPNSCSMAHCNPQMTDFVAQPPPGLNGSVYIRSRDPWDFGVSNGDGCIGNGTHVACVYNQSWNALVVYDGDGNILWGSGPLLDTRSYSGLPIMQQDGSVVAGDDQHFYYFNPDGSVAWVTTNPGGTPIGLLPTPNGAIFTATDAQQLTQCWQSNCALSFVINNGGAGYTTANVILAGGACPGATATAQISKGAISSVTTTWQGFDCDVVPDVIIAGDGTGAAVSAVLTAAAPVTALNGTTGAVVGSTYLYQTGNSGPYYATENTPCLNNGSYPNRLYLLTNLQTDVTQGALWAVDVDPTNLTSPITPAWSLPIHGPSGASPLCVGNNIYFDGAGIQPGDNVGTTIFGVQDNGTSGSFIFQVPLGPGTANVTCNFALDPRPVGGFWYQLLHDPNIWHRDFNTGSLIESINVSNLLTAQGAPPATYWQAGIFTTYGTADTPYLMLPMAPLHPLYGGYLAMVNLATQQLVWAQPMAGNDPANYDNPGGDAVLVLDSNQNPVIVMAGKQTGAYFITAGGPTAAVFPDSLSFGPQMAGTSSSTQTVTLTASASTALTISGIAASQSFTATNTCGASLAPGASCTISVAFSPTAAGPQSGSLTISTNAQSGPLNIPLWGSATAAAPIPVLSANQLIFPPQVAGTISTPQQVTLQDAGSVALAITSIAAGNGVLQSNNCPTALAPGAVCTINVMLAAPSTGACSGAVTVTTNALGGQQTISASGTCLPVPQIESALSTSSLVFAPQAVGTVSVAQAVKLTNIGILTLNIAAVAVTGDALQTNSCGLTLSPQKTCTINVSFSPAAIGPRTGAVIVTDAALDSPHIIAVSGVGLPNPVPFVNQPLLPTAFQPGVASPVVTVNGTGFLPGSVVYWNSTPRITQYISASQLSASLTAADVANPGTGGVTVVNPSPGGGQSNVVWLPVGYPSSMPVLTPTSLTVGSSPSALTAVDLNNDGFVDLAVSNAGSNTISVLLGNGDGTFAAHVDYATGAAPMAVAVGDFNQDGILDLVTANQTDNTVSIFLGAGGGVFQQQTVYATGNHPNAVIVADLNGDGNLDLAVTNEADNSVSILFGNGDGTFAGHLDYPVGQAPDALAAGDFNGDGKLDLAVANGITPGGSVSILLNHGDGSYLPGVQYATGDSVSVVTGDFNGDGQLDFAAANFLAESLSVYTGKGNGAFTLGPNQTTRLAPNPIGLVMGDVNSDGTLELMLGGNSGIGASALSNNNAASFAPLLQYGGVTGTTAIGAGDFNNDGSIDMALTVPGANTIAVLLQSSSVVLSTGSLNFGNVQVGANGMQTVTVTNSGSAMLSNVSVNTGGSFSQSNNCANPIPAGNTCTITVTFSPIAAGAQNGSLTIASNAPGGPQTVSLTGVGSTFTVTVSLSLNTFLGGSPLTSNTVALSSAAPAGGWTVTLSSSNPAVASVPSSVSVAAGASVSAAFSVTTALVAVNTPVTITASVNGSAGASVLTVTPIAASFATAAQTVYSGNLAQNSLILTSPAAPGDLVFNLTSSNPAFASVPATVTVSAGTTAAPRFNISTSTVATSTKVTIFASLSGLGAVSASATLTLLPAKLNTVTLTPSTITSGLASTGNVVKVVGMAPAGGMTITLTSSNPTVAAVPATVTIPTNGSSAPFTLTAGYIGASRQSTITATYSGQTATATVTVNPDAVTSWNLAATILVGGVASAGNNTVTLLAPAPPSGATINLSTSNRAVASIPATITVPAGSTISNSFKVTTTAVSVSTPVTLTATYNGVAVPITVTVNPLEPSAVTLSQTSVTGGKTITGTVSLNTVAPAGGLVVSLSSSNPAVASVPQTVIVAAGARVSPAYNVVTSVVTRQIPVTITAAYQGNSASATLSVHP